MQLGANRFERGGSAKRRQQIGLWRTPSTAFGAEVVAGAGFHWLVFGPDFDGALFTPRWKAAVWSGSAWERHNDGGGASNDTAWPGEPEGSEVALFVRTVWRLG